MVERVAQGRGAADRQHTEDRYEPRQAATDPTPPASLLRDKGVNRRRLYCLRVDGGIGVEGRGVRLGGVRFGRRLDRRRRLWRRWRRSGRCGIWIWIWIWIWILSVGGDLIHLSLQFPWRRRRLS